MIDRITRLCLGLCLLTLSTSVFADEVIDEARRLLSNQQGSSAYRLLAPLEDERAGTPEYDFLLGISALDAGYPGQAVFALERVLAVEPDNDLARAEIGRAYFELSEFENSKAQLKTVRDSAQVPETARASMDRYLSAIEQAQGKGTKISGFLSVAAGYDSNINSGTDQSQVAIPFLGTNLLFQLVDQAREQDAGYAQIGGAINIAQPVTDTISVVGGARGYVRETEKPFSTRNMYFYGGLQKTHGKHNFTLVGQGEEFDVNTDALRYVYGAFGQWRYAVDNRRQVSFALQVSQIDYPDVPNRDAMRYVASAGYVHAFAGKREPLMYIGVYGGTEAEERNQFAQFGHELYGGRIGGSLELAPKLRGYASFSVEERDYGGQDAIFLRQRDDTQIIASAGFEYAFKERWSLRPNMSYTNNDSNIPISDYDRIVAGIDLSLRF